MKPERALRKQALTKLRNRFDALEARLVDGRPYVMGDTFTVADSYTFVVAWRSRIIDFALPAAVLDKTPATTFVVIDGVEMEHWGIGGFPVAQFRRQLSGDGGAA